jgi:hypothetical protein
MAGAGSAVGREHPWAPTLTHGRPEGRREISAGRRRSGRRARAGVAEHEIGPEQGWIARSGGLLPAVISSAVCLRLWVHWSGRKDGNLRRFPSAKGRARAITRSPSILPRHPSSGCPLGTAPKW